MSRTAAARSVPNLRQLPNGSSVRCHFSEEIDASEWTPTEDILPPSLEDRETIDEPILKWSILKSTTRFRAAR